MRYLIEALTAALIVAVVVLAIRQQMPPWTMEENELWSRGIAVRTEGPTAPIPADLVVGCGVAEVRTEAGAVPVRLEDLGVELLIVPIPPDRQAAFDLRGMDRSTLKCP